jgi:hypothetical protein
MAKARRTIVGRPLTPTLLTDLGAVGRRPVSTGPFDPGSNWTQTYRIWTCHGYHESGNEDVGYLRLQKKALGERGTFTLGVEQRVVEADALVSRVEADIVCRNDAVASPVRWRLSSRFFGPDGQELTDLGARETVSVEADTLVTETSTGTRRRQVPVPLTSDWSLWEAVGRLDVRDTREREVNLLEGLGILRPKQHLSYRGVHQERFGPETMSLHCFGQWGPGVLPTTYWLDPAHRLVAVISMNKAYILDDQAEDVVRRKREELEESYRRAQTRRREQERKDEVLR